MHVLSVMIAGRKVNDIFAFLWEAIEVVMISVSLKIAIMLGSIKT